MNCPKCTDFEMVEEHHGDATVFLCPTCRGMYFRKGQLTKVLHGGLSQDIDRLDFAAVSGQMDILPAHCPRCDGLLMDPVPGPGGVRIDRCSKCGAIFLDQGELATIALQRS